MLVMGYEYIHTAEELAFKWLGRYCSSDTWQRHPEYEGGKRGLLWEITIGEGDRTIEYEDTICGYCRSVEYILENYKSEEAIKEYIQPYACFYDKKLSFMDYKQFSYWREVYNKVKGFSNPWRTELPVIQNIVSV